MQAKKKTKVIDKVPAIPISTTKWPNLIKPRFPITPELFHPKGLYIGFTAKIDKGWAVKWNLPGTKISIFEWNQDYTDAVGQHYHVMTSEMQNKHLEGNHYHPGDLIPEPWASLYFS